MMDLNLTDDILFAFSVEPQHDRQTLENYLRRYPELAVELIDLSHELRLAAEFGEVEGAALDARMKREGALEALRTWRARFGYHAPGENTILDEMDAAIARLEKEGRKDG